MFKPKLFSAPAKVIQELTQKLEKEKEYDYSVENKIPKDSISVTADLGNLEIYIPKDFEYSQYEIDDFLRELVPYAYSDTRMETGGVYHMTIKGARLTPGQYYKLLKFIIKEGEFCVILDR